MQQYILKRNFNVVQFIIGKPNVGKSGLLNALLEEDKAIVTDIAGTTRDIVEGQISINGILLNIIDTAGIRETNDIIESICLYFQCCLGMLDLFVLFGKY